jgi:hypothetical protein
MMTSHTGAQPIRTILDVIGPEGRYSAGIHALSTNL